MLNRSQSEAILAAWLSLGLFTLLTGFFWLTDRSLYSKAFYLLFALPAFVGVIVARAEMLPALKQPAMLLFLLLAAWVIISLGWAEGEKAHLSLIKRPLYIFLLLVGLIYLGTLRAVIPLRHVVLVSMVVVTAFVAWSAPEFIEMRKPWHRYIGPGSLVHPLLTSHILAFLFVFGIVSVLLADKWDRFVWICLLCCPMLLWGIVLTGSRTPLVGIAAVLCWLCLIHPSRRTFGMLALMATLTVLAYLIQPTIFTSRGVSWRPEIWSAAIDKIMERPLIGHGFDGSIDFVVEKMKKNWRDPHNIVLAVALELGVIGLLIWVAMHAAALYACVAQRVNPDAVVASCLLVFGLAGGLTEGSNFFSRPNESWFITWLPLAFAIAATAKPFAREGNPQSSS